MCFMQGEATQRSDLASDVQSDGKLMKIVRMTLAIPGFSQGKKAKT